MAALQPACRLRTTSVPLFLAPAFATSSIRSSFSVSFRQHKSTKAERSKPKGDANKKRGVSAIKRTPGRAVPPRAFTFPLPEPAADAEERRKEFPTNPKHGLWGFFNSDREAMIPPEAEAAHGRSWTYQELTIKSFTDLHGLYWRCILEQNMASTRHREMRRVKSGHGLNEADRRIETIQATMKKIRHVLHDRQANFLEAQSILRQNNLEELLAEEEVFANVEAAEDPTTPQTLPDSR